MIELAASQIHPDVDKTLNPNVWQYTKQPDSVLEEPDN